MYNDSQSKVYSPPQSERNGDRKLVVALVGNPNTGKTTLYNRLTGSRQRVGNYPGVTVEKREGRMRLGGTAAEIVDLPGAYSLAASSADEAVVVDYLTGSFEAQTRPDVVVCVVDATNLIRNLFLVSQVADTGCPLVIALNMSDEAKTQGIEVDHELLAKRLGVPVVPTIATKGRGIETLKKEIQAAFGSGRRMEKVPWPKNISESLSILRNDLNGFLPESVSEAEMQRMLFDGDSAVGRRLGIPAQRLSSILDRIRSSVDLQGGLDFAHLEPMVRYEWLTEKIEGVVAENERSEARLTDAIDAYLTHRVFGLFTFLGVMYVVFQSIYTFAGPFMALIEESFGYLGKGIGNQLASMPMLQSLVVDGVIAGVGGVLIFLPQILILFLFIAVLEDSGYMARAALLMDKAFGWCGLNGKSFVPLISSYACSVPGVMAARTIEDPKSRLVTILIAPLMSCSARLPVYVLLIGAFIEPVWGAGWAGFTLFAMHFIGLLVAIPAASVFSRVFSQGERIPLILELPPYRVPQVRDVLWRMWERGKHFLGRAGTVILCMSVVIWALTYFPHSEEVAVRATDNFIRTLAAEQGVDVQEATLLASEEPVAANLERAVDAAYIEQSIIGRLGKTLQPVFAPAGFDWKITVGILASFPAREVIISTLGILYNLGGEVDEGSSVLASSMGDAVWADGSPVFTPLVAIGIMVFFALCMQCGATMAVIAGETRWRWALFAFVYMTVLAWTGAVLVHQIGSMIV